MSFLRKGFPKTIRLIKRGFPSGWLALVILPKLIKWTKNGNTEYITQTENFHVRFLLSCSLWQAALGKADYISR